VRLSTRIALAVGATVPVLVLATGWLLLRLVAADLHDQQDTHLRERAVAVAKDARSLLRASAAGRRRWSRPANAGCSPRPWTWAYG
jgi:two-component system sensor histidine kinase PrrB